MRINVIGGLASLASSASASQELDLRQRRRQTPMNDEEGNWRHRRFWKILNN